MVLSAPSCEGIRPSCVVLGFRGLSESALEGLAFYSCAPASLRPLGPRRDLPWSSPVGFISSWDPRSGPGRKVRRIPTFCAGSLILLASRNCGKQATAEGAGAPGPVPFNLWRALAADLLLRVSEQRSASRAQPAVVWLRASSGIRTRPAAER